MNIYTVTAMYTNMLWLHIILPFVSSKDTMQFCPELYPLP